MKKIGIVTDSTADLPRNLIEHYGINVVALKVFFGQEEFKDGFDLTSQEFYEKLKTSPHHPRTSQPSPAEFKQVYQKLLKDYETIISTHLSSKLSGTYQSAKLASEMLGNDIVVIDSKQASMVLGLMVLEAARAVEEGLARNEVLKSVKEIADKIKVYFAVDTLEYLEKGGRIGRASAFLGNLLNIKPVLTLVDGEVSPVEKVRGSKKVLKKLIEKMESSIKPTSKIKVSVIHAADPETAEVLVQEINKRFNVEELILAELGAVIGTYVGPGTIGITFYEV
ncbi:MAG: fatty acid kinase fatty acid binding subunit [Thermosediminibacterales bacterium]|nr:fatty acid kinase fatty acid binding subunit [Thermosediminibacterales bacterium]MDK2835453.1 fatty acid kinase fatty acid binding subunit [Thermosediminibacterales bacterium]